MKIMLILNSWIEEKKSVFNNITNVQLLWTFHVLVSILYHKCEIFDLV